MTRCKNYKIKLLTDHKDWITKLVNFEAETEYPDEKVELPDNTPVETLKPSVGLSNFFRGISS